ncbi:MAG: SGNH/GDSL hydrolase family protein [Vulcanimicrobiota bacterium]
MVALGDSLTAGTQDGVTRLERQRMVYTRQLAQAAGIEFNMPEITSPGIPFEIFGEPGVQLGPFGRLKKTMLTALAPLAAWAYYLGAPPFLYPSVVSILGGGERTVESRDKTQHSFAIAGFEARHLAEVANPRDFMELIHNRTETVNGLAQQVPLIKATLQKGGGRTIGTELEQAIEARPDLAVLWAGSNDALEAAFAGRIDDRTLTPIEDGPWSFRDPGLIRDGAWMTTDKALPGFRSTMVGEKGLITRLLNETEAEVMLLNVPDPSVIPNLIKVGGTVGRLPYRLVLPDGTDVTRELEEMVIPRRIRGEGNGGRRFFPPGSKVPVLNLLGSLMDQGSFTSREALHRSLFKVQTEGMLGEDDVLDPEESARVQTRVGEYNQILRRAAEQNPRVHLVDVNRVLSSADRDGRDLRGAGADQRITTTYTGIADGRGYGGMFSFDGVHPSDTGHAVVANVLLDTIKSELAGDPRFAAFMAAEPIDEKAVYANDPHQDSRQVLVLERSALDSLSESLG